jgi:hypothetical protein
MFRALLAHPQQASHKRHLAYCARVMSVGYLSAVCETPLEDEQVMLEIYRGP